MYEVRSWKEAGAGAKGPCRPIGRYREGSQNDILIYKSSHFTT